MADSTSPTEGSNFENDFEKVDPLGPGLADGDHLVSSSDVAADPFSGSSKLIDFDASPVRQPDPPSMPIFEEPAPPPAAKSDSSSKPQVATGESYS